MNNYDLIIVGAGPAGIFTALELLRKSSKTTGPRICLIEKGKPVEKRHCPKDKTGHCVNCKPTCAITTGFSGAGAFSDGKLSLSASAPSRPACSWWTAPSATSEPKKPSSCT